MTRWEIGGYLFSFLVMIAVGLWLIDGQVKDCHAKGGEIDYLTWNRSAGLCLTPDGRIVQ